MKAHLLVMLAPGVRPAAEPPSWEDVAAGLATAPERFIPPVDRVLDEHHTPVWVTHEYRPAGGAQRFSSDEVLSGLDRRYRLVLQRDGTVPPGVVDALAALAEVESARAAVIGAVDLPALVPAAMSAGADRASREAIGLPEAQRHSTGDPSITIAVLDTGVDLQHPEIQQTLLPGRDFVDIIDGATRFLGDFLEADDIPDDEVGHGTHVAGIIAARGLAMPRGVVPSCRILPVRVLGALRRDGGGAVGAGLVDNINAGIKWAVDEGADVISMSLGVEATGAEQPHKDVIEYARRKGVSVVAASGNDGSGTTTYYPGGLPYAIAVGATDPEGEVAAFSTWGRQVDLVAPGTDIYSCLPHGRYGFSTGTSHATPFVSGAVALLAAVARHAGRPLGDSRVKHLLRNTADRLDTRFRHPKAGFGRLNLLDAVRLLEHKLGHA